MSNFRDLIGKPYKTHGRGPEEYDCFGLAIEVLKRYGKTLPDAFYHDENRKGNATVIKEFAYEHMVERVEAPEESDIFVIRVGGYPSHLGVYIGAGKYIHASKRGVRVEDITSIRSKIEGIYRWLR